jgi:hypothetical protein
MVTPQLLDYIKKQQSQGVNNDAILKSLQDSNWPMEDIQMAFSQLNSVTNPLNNTSQMSGINLERVVENKKSKADSFFGEVKDPKLTAIFGAISVLVSIFIFQYAFYSIGLLMGIYGAYHGFRQKKWLLFVANLAVCVFAIVIKILFHKN